MMLKEQTGSGKLNAAGYLILNEDNDETRRIVEQRYRTTKTLVNPIVDWSEAEVWEFLNDVAKVPHCSLYNEGLYSKTMERLLKETGKPFPLHNKVLSTDPEQIINDWAGQGE